MGTRGLTQGQAIRRLREAERLNRELLGRLRANGGAVDPGALAALSAQNSRLMSFATTDSLTGLPNKRAMRDLLDQELARADRSGGGLAVLFADLDHFKAVNDTRGHQAGDEVLAGAGALLARSVRAVDRVGRWGGEEFVVLLPGAGRAAAAEVAERVRADLAQHAFPGGLGMTASLGVAVYPADGRTGEGLLAAADTAMYAAKAGGRDRVCVAGCSPRTWG